MLDSSTFGRHAELAGQVLSGSDLTELDLTGASLSNAAAIVSCATALLDSPKRRGHRSGVFQRLIKRWCALQFQRECDRLC
jgi:uncharacterized protein YjbI with pentapeptide repeats